MNEEKKSLVGLFRDNPDTPEGKYLVKRRDGTVVEWPSFVLGARDPIAVVALRAYAKEVSRILTEDVNKAQALGLTRQFEAALFREAMRWDRYRIEQGEGDPGKGKHRKDDIDTVEEMKKGRSC